MTKNPNPASRTVKVDGFTYTSMAPERRVSRACSHYVQQAADAASGLRTPVQDDVIDRGIAAVTS